MSCSICFNDPPENPVLTVDGSIYCLECIIAWFNIGKSTSPTTNLQIPKILIPANTICQMHNLDITKIPDEFTGINKVVVNQNNTYQRQVYIPPPPEIVAPAEEPPAVLRFLIPNNLHTHGYYSRGIYNNFIKDITKLHDLIIHYTGSFSLNDELFIDHEFKFRNINFYKYQWSNYGSRRETTCPIALVALFSEANFELFDNLVKPKIYYSNVYFRNFINLIPLKLIYNQELIRKGVELITLRTGLYRKGKKHITKFELINIIQHARPEFVNINKSWADMYKFIMDEKIKVNVTHWLTMYAQN